METFRDKVKIVAMITVAMVAVALVSFESGKRYAERKMENQSKILGIYTVEGMGTSSFTDRLDPDTYTLEATGSTDNGNIVLIYDFTLFPKQTNNIKGIKYTLQFDDSLSDLITPQESIMYFGTEFTGSKIVDKISEGKVTKGIYSHTAKGLTPTMEDYKVQELLKLPLKLRYDNNGIVKFITVFPTKTGIKRL